MITDIRAGAATGRERCPDCGRPIVAGDDFFEAEGRGAVHTRCYEAWDDGPHMSAKARAARDYGVREGRDY